MNTPVKKVAKKTVAKKVIEAVKNIGKYHVLMKFNDIEHDFYTDDLASSILERAPRFLKTKITFHIKKDGKVCDRLLFVRGGKMLFRNKLSLKIFTDKLIFK